MSGPHFEVILGPPGVDSGERFDPKIVRKERRERRRAEKRREEKRRGEERRGEETREEKSTDGDGLEAQAKYVRREEKRRGEERREEKRAKNTRRPS